MNFVYTLTVPCEMNDLATIGEAVHAAVKTSVEDLIASGTAVSIGSPKFHMGTK